ncbi:MAG: hypothetical protein ACREOI_36455 [bacterium]
MSKKRKHLVVEEPASPVSPKTDMSNIENRLNGDDGKQPKEVSGIWVLLILGGLLLVVLLSHWLRQ